MGFGTVLRSAPSIWEEPFGIGGSAEAIYNSIFSMAGNYELTPTDMSAIAGGSAPDTYNFGIGGNDDVIWHSDVLVDTIYELSRYSIGTVVRSAPSPSGGPYGIGGDDTTIWHTDPSQRLVYELAESDFSVIRSAGAPDISTDGIGGSHDVIWDCDNYWDEIHELSVADFSILRQGYVFVADIASGMGGDWRTMWLCGWRVDSVFEIDADVQLAKYVDIATGDDNDDGWSWPTAYETIKKGIDNIGPGDILHIAEGDYYRQKDIDLKKTMTFICEDYGGGNANPPLEVKLPNTVTDP